MLPKEVFSVEFRIALLAQGKTTFPVGEVHMLWHDMAFPLIFTSETLFATCKIEGTLEGTVMLHLNMLSWKLSIYACCVKNQWHGGITYRKSEALSKDLWHCWHARRSLLTLTLFTEAFSRSPRFRLAETGAFLSMGVSDLKVLSLAAEM